MRFFTPELWLAFQGSRRDAAFKAWDRRFALYRKTLDKILPKLNASARPFFRDALILHDATLTRMEIGDRIDDAESALTWRDIVNRRKLRVRLFVLADTFHRGRPVKNYWYVLEYKKVERLELNSPGKIKLFSSGKEPNLGDWGYDELTLHTRRTFRHEILFSSGSTISIEFRDFCFRRKPAKEHPKT